MNKLLSPEDYQNLLTVLKNRFDKHPERHVGVLWADVEKRLEALPQKVWSLSEMERTGGEPDVVAFDTTTGEIVFADCAKESPSGRRSLCYDRQAQQSRKEFAPQSNVLDVAAEMGIELLTEEEYKQFHKLVTFDAKTSSWIHTPPEIRKLGGALFADFRYNQVFVYHNGAQSYYAARGFRGKLAV